MMQPPFDNIEEWRPIARANGSYEISNLGRVRRAVQGRTSSIGKILKPYLSGFGYSTVALRVGGKSVRLSVHRLVAVAFIGLPPTPHHEINHRNGFKADNYVSNLEWVTPSENRYHEWRTGLRKHVP